MSGHMDPVEVARGVLDRTRHQLGLVHVKDMEAMARVVLAAEERVKHGHSERFTHCELFWAEYVADNKRCTCGHDALVAALKGE